MDVSSSYDASDEDFSEMDVEKRGEKESLLRSIFVGSIEESAGNPLTLKLFNWLQETSNRMTYRNSRVQWLVNMIDSDDFVAFYKKFIHYLISADSGSHLRSLHTRPVIIFSRLHFSLWNVTDKSPEVCCRLIVHNVHQSLFKLINTSDLAAPTCLSNSKARALIHCSIGILHNIINFSPSCRREYRRCDAVNILVAFATDVPNANFDTDMLSFRIAALFLLANIVDESENATIHANDKHIVHVLSMLADALDSAPNYFSSAYGYHAEEIIRCLNKLSSPDANKRILVENKALELAKRSLEIANNLKMCCNGHEIEFNDPSSEVTYNYSSPDSLAAVALAFIWQLSFIRESCEYLLECSDLYHLCERFKDSSWSFDCRKSAQGLLWNTDSVKNGHSSHIYSIPIENHFRNPDGHIMISYQHSTKQAMHELKRELVNLGYDVWIDVDHMSHGSFVDEMATAVEGACALILGLCQAFKDSPHCRQEMRYAYDLHIPFYPVLVEEDYKPDGWLAFLLATIIVLPATSLQDICVAARKIADHLGDTGKIKNRHSFDSAPSSVSSSCPVINHQRSKSASIPESNYSTQSLSSRNISSEGFRSRSHLTLPETGPRPFSPLSAKSFRKLYSTDEKFYSFTSSNSPSPRFSFDSSLHKISVSPPTSSVSNNQVSTLRNLPSPFFDSGKSPRRDTQLTPKSSCYTFDNNQSREVLPSVRIRNWSAERVSDWFTKFAPSDSVKYFAGFDGCLLWELARQRIVAPESFFTNLRRDFCMKMIEQYRISYALSQLPIDSSEDTL